MISVEIGKTYKLSLQINNNILTYSCVVKNKTEDSVIFIDKFGKEYEYRRDLIIGKQPIDNTLLEQKLRYYLNRDMEENELNENKEDNGAEKSQF